MRFFFSSFLFQHWQKLWEAFLSNIFFFVHSFFLKFSKVGSKIMLPINWNLFRNPDFINSGAYQRRRRGGKKRDDGKWQILSLAKGIHSTQPHWHIILLCSVCIQSTKIDFSDDFFSWSNLPSMVVFWLGLYFFLFFCLTKIPIGRLHNLSRGPEGWLCNGRPTGLSRFCARSTRPHYQPPNSRGHQNHT